MKTTCRGKGIKFPLLTMGLVSSLHMMPIATHWYMWKMHEIILRGEQILD